MKKFVIVLAILVLITSIIRGDWIKTKAYEEAENPNEEMLIEQALLEKANKFEGCYCEIESDTIPDDATVMVDTGDGIIHYYLGGEIAGLECDVESHDTTTVYWVVE